LDYPPEIRTVIYTTDAIESLRKVTKTRGYFPNDDALLKLLYLAIRNLGRTDHFGDTSNATWNWRAALNQFEIFFPGRLRVA
jgi:putative transposase